MRLILWLVLAILLGTQQLSAKDRNSLILQSTTSTRNSGLFDHILPLFEKSTGIKVHVVAVGTGQALENSRRGDGDVLLVHARDAEELFVKNGFGLERYNVMYNDFVIVGPTNDPAGIRSADNVLEALTMIANNKSIFISRGDNSGTHKKERQLWRELGIDQNTESGSWYRETGSGMGATLNIASAVSAYTLSDRGTWIAFANKRNLEILYQGDPRLINQYGIMLVNPDRHPQARASEGQAFIDWIIGKNGQAAINSYTIEGQQLFYGNSGR